VSAVQKLLSGKTAVEETADSAGVDVSTTSCSSRAVPYLLLVQAPFCLLGLLLLTLRVASSCGCQVCRLHHAVLQQLAPQLLAALLPGGNAPLAPMSRCACMARLTCCLLIHLASCVALPDTPVSADDEKTMDAVSRIIAACSGPLACGGKVGGGGWHCALPAERFVLYIPSY
jgi:hypothetical protein